MKDREPLLSLIMATPGRTSYSEAPQIPESTVIEARYAYDQCAQALRETCWHLD